MDVRTEGSRDEQRIDARRAAKSSRVARVFDYQDGAIPMYSEPSTPSMFPFVALDQSDVDHIASSVPGGIENIQDIYPLSSLQEGMLFHNVLGENADTYVLLTLLELRPEVSIESFCNSLQKVIDRHDALRTAILWENLPTPVQVVYRKATIIVDEFTLDNRRDVAEQLQERMKPEHQGMNLRRAPLVRVQVATDRRSGKHFVLMKLHHVICEHQSWGLILEEISLCLCKRELPAPIGYRDYFSLRSTPSDMDDAKFFRKKLGDVEEPTAPYGVFDVHGDGSRIEVAGKHLDALLSESMRDCARRNGTSPARFFHAVWAVVTAHLSGQDDVVYGTVLLSRHRRRSNTEPLIGLFVNTLPLRIRLRDRTSSELLEHTRVEIDDLLEHEHASLALAQRCASNVTSHPLFNSVLNYRRSAAHPVVEPNADLARVSGLRVVGHQYRTNYPIALVVDDRGQDFSLSVQTDRRIDPIRIIGYVETALWSLIRALNRAPTTLAMDLEIIPEAELRQVTALFNEPQRSYPETGVIHSRIEEQASRRPDAVAACYQTLFLTYGELNRRADTVARYLRGKGVSADQLVGVCLERSLDLVVALFAVLKAGGAYVPLDPAYPEDRLKYMLADASPRVVLIQEALRQRVPDVGADVVALDSDWKAIEQQVLNCNGEGFQSLSHQLAYVIYTSGSTGAPKGVLVEHFNVTRLLDATVERFSFSEYDVWTLFHSTAFDFSVWELWGALTFGARVVIVPQLTARAPEQFYRVLCDEGVTILNQTPSAFAQLINAQTPSARSHALRLVVFGGEPLELDTLRPWVRANEAAQTRLINMYGITETTVHVTYREVTQEQIQSGASKSVGRALDDLHIYILDRQGKPAAIGVAGEIFVGGAGLARGYLNRADLTSERFIADHLSGTPGTRLYRTGDVGRWQPDGTFEHLGRNDLQVKIRGYRIELGEIEARIRAHQKVKDVTVLLREDLPGDKRLTAYVVGAEQAHAEIPVGSEGSSLLNEVVEAWESVFKETYSSESADVGPTFVGWNSSYTGEPIPEPEMAEWLENSVARIRTLHPKRVLEIGCGVGLVLQHIAPDSELYVGTDFSADALRRLQRWVDTKSVLRHVKLLHRPATELGDLQNHEFDTVILNSVVQYFPDIEYFMIVLRAAVKLLRPGGNIFVGDVRHLGSLSMFATSVQLTRAAANLSVGRLKKRVLLALSEEKELVIDPELFQVLPWRMPGVSAVDVQLRRGHAPNELTRYRYDVVVHVGEFRASSAVCDSIGWSESGLDHDALKIGLGEKKWRAIRIQAIPNSRLANEAAAQRLVESSDDSLEVGVLRKRLVALESTGEDPEALWELGRIYGYEVAVGWGAGHPPETMDVTIVGSAASEESNRGAASKPTAIRPWKDYATAPLEYSAQRALVSELRVCLNDQLPSHMVPQSWVVLKELPLTINGKLDRRALPIPQNRREALGEYVPPRSELEQALAGVWAEVLRVDQVGTQDNFFELGGHSFLIVQLIERLRVIGLHLKVRDVYEAPTLAALASRLTSEAAVLSGIPENLITPASDAITPEMLPLANLDANEIEKIVRTVPGGVKNVQDIYPLAPLQEGMLFHRLLGDSSNDVYGRVMLFSLSSRYTAKRFAAALQALVDRHDVLRTAILWKELSEPVQVVYRAARLRVEEFTLKEGRSALEQMNDLMADGKSLDLSSPPLMRLTIGGAADEADFYAILQTHHIIFDNESLEGLIEEALALVGDEPQIRKTRSSYRDHVARGLAYRRTRDAEAFFREKLRGIDEPTAPFGLLGVHGDGTQAHEIRRSLSSRLAKAILMQARLTGTSAATLFHAAWGLTVSRISTRDDVVYGTVLSMRIHEGAIGQQPLGMFINTLPLRLDVLSTSASGLVALTQRELSELLDNGHASLAVAQRCSGVPASTPLFSSVLNYVRRAANFESGDTNSKIELISAQGRTNYPVLLTVYDKGDEFTLELKTDPSISPERLYGYMVRALEILIEALEHEPQIPARDLNVVPKSELGQVVEQFSGKSAESVDHKLVNEGFDDQVRIVPSSIAVSYEDRYLTFEGLHRRADRLAVYLRQNGVGPDVLVALCVERSVEMVVGVLGVLKAGGAYVPLDPTNPTERLAHILEDAKPKILLTQQRLKVGLPPTAAEVLSIDADWDLVERLSEDSIGVLHPLTNSRSLAYAIYTSGSTGRPKGVMVEHGSLANYAYHAARQFDVASGDGSLVSTSISFDLMLTGFYPTLLCGKALRLCAEEQGLPLISKELLKFGNLAPVKLTPSHMALLNDDLTSGALEGRIRALVLGGESLRASVVSSWRAHSPSTRIFNHYGPTEATVGCVVHEALEISAGNLPIGRPITNARIYILDRHMHPVPIGVPGEIYIGGRPVARGYLGRPDLTAERFVADPFDDDGRSRLYRTGDLACWSPEGLIDFIGRNDHQVKIRGFRIELGEIESSLARYPLVKQAVVVPREDVPGEKRLVAYVVPIDGAAIESLSVDKLRMYLRTCVPEYMVPAAYVMLEQIPLTANGKLDRRALPAPEADSYSRKLYETPEGDIEITLARVWQELLRVERVGRHDNFFELGGHSLLIVQMMERLRRAGFSGDVRAAFNSETLADLAANLRRRGEQEEHVPDNLIPLNTDAITADMLTLVQLAREHIDSIVASVPGGAQNIKDIYPLAPLQEGLLFHHVLDEHRGDTYVEAFLLELASRDRANQLIESVQAVIDRHDVLRTAVLWEHLPHPVQVVYRQATLPVEEIQLDPASDAVKQLARLMEPIRLRMDLRLAPLLRLQVAKDPLSAKCFVVMQLHHVTTDHVTTEVIISEIVAHMEKRANTLPKSNPYRNHVAQALRYARKHDADSFFRKKLGDVNEPTAPFQILEVHGDSAHVAEGHRALDLNLARRIRFQARCFGVSSAALFHAAWALVVARTSGRDDVVFGTVLLGRLRGSAGAQHTLGMFINTLPLRFRLNGVGAAALVEGAHTELAEILEYEQVSLALVQRCSGVAGTTPLFSALLNYRYSAPNRQAEWENASGVHLLAVQARTNYPITFSIDDIGERFALSALTSEGIDPNRVIELMHTSIDSLVGALERDPKVLALDLEIMPKNEYVRVVNLFNSTARDYPDETPIHELFEEHARASADSIAIVYECEHLTYSGLNAHANRLAWYLNGRGLVSGDYLPVLMARGPRMLVAQLAALKIGAAYVPIDSKLPLERRSLIVTDCKARWMLIDERARDEPGDGPPGHGLVDSEYIDCSTIEAEISRMPARNLGVSLTSSHPTYVMYTSGSTGVPKGVVVPHRAVSRLVLNNGYAEIGRDDCIAHCSNPAFDASTFEIWGALLNGAKLLIVSEPVVLEASLLSNVLIGQNATVLWLTAGLFAQHVRIMSEAFRQLRYLLVGGDVVDPQSVTYVLRDGRPGRLLNGYGPTEATTFSAAHLIDDEDRGRASIPIGRPISNTQIYILDRRFVPVPAGVAGEIYIAGAGLAQGYLDRPELTAARFLANPFSPVGRLYKTGDTGRWRDDGTIEYLGRNDHQVKLSGYRIELGDIESQLLRRADIRSAAVLVREEEPGEKRLVAYVVPDWSHLEGAHGQNPQDAGAEIVDQWNELYEETYSTSDIAPSFVGWNSSYTGLPIPEQQMLEWLRATIERILSLKPRKVLEIGCGVGLLLQHLAPECQTYRATDFSREAIERLAKWVQTRPELEHVQLEKCSALELDSESSDKYDTVILNSVVQYFPDITYLKAVLRLAAQMLLPGGRIFVGDVRHFGLLETFHSSVQLAKAASGMSVGELRIRIDRAMEREKELVIDPTFFVDLKADIASIGRVRVLVKRGDADNELARYRYDVVLETGEIETPVPESIFEWPPEKEAGESFIRLVTETRPASVRVRNVKNTRLSRDAAVHRLVKTSEEWSSVEQLNELANMADGQGASPESFWRLGAELGYQTDVRWSNDSASSFDVEWTALNGAGVRFGIETVAPHSKSVYANDPLRRSSEQQLVPVWREYLKKSLPSYMVPSAIILLESLPLTQNGKLDRRALLAKDLNIHSTGQYEAPQGKTEELLAGVWQELLRVERIGRNDSFFDLGGHSLLVIRALAAINKRLGSALRVIDVYSSPTIRELAAHISGAGARNDLVDLSKEAVLDASVVPISGRLSGTPSSVLLTGCTGFVGRFLLTELLKGTEVNVYCLVRGATVQQAHSRIRENLKKWDLWKDEWNARIVAVVGDLKASQLGIERDTYLTLGREIESIYHCGTSMNHLETYAMARSANVESAKELLKFATQGRPKLINYISSLGVFSSLTTNFGRTVNERTSIDEERHLATKGYVASKWVAEKIFLSATERGIPCNIFRLGLIWADTERGRYDELQRGYRIFKSCVLSGFGIKNYRYDAPPTPVDYVSRAIVSLAERNRSGHGVFHISASEHEGEGVFELYNKLQPRPLKLLPLYKWIEEIKRLHNVGVTLPAVPLIEFAFGMDENSFYEHQARWVGRVRFDCSRTREELALVGIVEPAFNEQLLRLYVQDVASRDPDLRLVIQSITSLDTSIAM